MLQKKVDNDAVVLSQQLKITVELAKYILKQNQDQYDRVSKAAKRYHKLETQITNLSQIFSKYSIDGSIKYVNEKQDSYSQFMKDTGMINDTIAQLYWTYKCRALKDAEFTLNEFILGMLKFKCSNIQELKKSVQTMKKQVIEGNKYKKLYSYYFRVISKGTNLISFSNAIQLWEHFLKDTFVQIIEFTSFCRAKSDEFQRQTRVSFDLWCQVWKFFEVIGTDYSKFDENDAWPLLIYEFVQFQKR